MNTNFFDYTLEPGKELNKDNKYEDSKPIISVVTPFYNSIKYIRQTVYSILNQTFPCFELLIIDDGSKDEASLKELEKIAKLDDRIKVFHKENEGLAATRDYGASKASEFTKYILFIDDDDLLEPTFLECAYWTLETNADASWAYSDSIGFDAQQYTWNKWFDSERMKKQNDLIVASLVRKSAFKEVNGYELREKAVNEDWNFWLKLIAKGKYPVRMSFYGLWYRRKGNTGELYKASQNRERSMEIINNTSKTIKKPVKAIQYPRQNYNWDKLYEELDGLVLPKRKANNKINILMIIPWMTTGGADKFNMDFLKGLNKDTYDVTIITTEPQVNNYRQEFEKYATVYDLTTFIDRKYWLAFVNYIIQKNNINFIMNTNSRFGYEILPYLKGKYPTIPIIDYVHMEEWYNRNGGYSRDSSVMPSILDRTLVCNKNSENILVDYFERERDELKTVYIGVDEKEYDPSKISEREKEKILEKYEINKNGRFIISYICRIAEQKRPHLLMQIAKRLKENRDDFLIVVAGDGYMLNDIKREAYKYNLTDHIKFIGNTTNTKEIYAISDLTINCSIKEGIALTSYESLAMGVPVVSADVGGQNELIDENVGVIVPCLQKENEIFDFKYKQEEIENYVNAINKVLDNLDKYKSKCRDRILNKFTIKQMNENMDNIIQEIYKNPNNRKIENGKGLSNNLNITKELICLFLEESNKQFAWQCQEYNKNYYELTPEFRVTKWSKIKEKLWTYPAWRNFVKFLQKTGIIRVIKKLIGKKE